MPSLERLSCFARKIFMKKSYCLGTERNRQFYDHFDHALSLGCQLKDFFQSGAEQKNTAYWFQNFYFETGLQV